MWCISMNKSAAGENKAVGLGGAAKGIAERVAKDVEDETYEQVLQAEEMWSCIYI